MVHMVKELMRLKDLTAAGDDGFEMLTQLLARAKQIATDPRDERDSSVTRDLQSLRRALWQT